MPRLVVASLLAATLLLPFPSAEAKSARRARARGRLQLTAYTVGGQSTIHVARCRARPPARVRTRGRGRPAPIADDLGGPCAKRFKATAARLICRQLGSGRHEWYYTVGPRADRLTALVVCL
jgi:hypothetical protein